MSVYLDVSALIPLFIEDGFTSQAEAIVQNATTTIIISAARLGASLATFDVRMAEAARALGVAVEAG